MSFICEHCNNAQPDGSKPNRVVTKTHEVQHKDPEKHKDERTGETITIWHDSGIGSQILEEKNLCDDCYNLAEYAKAIFEE